MSITPNMAISLLVTQQAQKEITVNEALLRIDALLNSFAISAQFSNPPNEVKDGDLYIIAVNATGEWQGKEQQLAFFYQGWRYIKPNLGLALWVKDKNSLFRFNGQHWQGE